MLLQKSPLADLIRNCSLCTARKECRMPVPGEGPEGSKIVFVARNPGATEDKLNRPLVGRAGQDGFDTLLVALSIDRSKVGIVNRAKCSTVEDRCPEDSEFNACEKWLKYELAFFSPKILVLMGNDAVAAFFKKDMPGITKLEGKVATVGERSFFFMCHPSYYARGAGNLLEEVAPRLRFLVSQNKEIYDAIKV